jgi:ankyrin repeat protein
MGICCVTVLVTASADDARVANAAMKGDKETVRNLIWQAADINAARGDGMTALHWAALNNDSEMTQILLAAGANVRATTRLGSYTPLFMAAKAGASGVLDLLLKAGADPKGKGTDGINALMMAAMAGKKEAVRLLIENGADVNSKESEHGQTPLIFAAAFNRPEVVDELIKHGADMNLATVIQPYVPIPADGVPPRPADTSNALKNGVEPFMLVRASTSKPPSGDAGERGGGNPRGGLTPLMYAARDGHLNAVQALVENGAKLDAVSGDGSTALLLTTINGHFDVAKYLVEHGANVSVPSVDGATALYGVVHVQWSRESGRPQPSIKREETNYLDLMRLMLDNGADPNARLTKTLWYSSYGYAMETSTAVGTTDFWKCAEVGDIDGMKLLLSRGADPNITNRDGVTALLIATGAGTHGNDDIMAPPGRMASVKYLVEQLHMDVNAAENASAPGVGDVGTRQPQGGPQVIAGGGFTALHNAASRGDNEMILYLVARGARVDAVTMSGVTVVDQANGPRQRIQPFPETIALLEMLGASNSHKCVSC